MLRKVSMVMIDVVLGPSGVAVQALVALLMLALMFFATSKVSPFEQPHILRLEMISLSTSSLTLWLGSFFWATNNSTYHEGLSIFIVIINVIFLVYLTTTLVGDTCRDYKVVEAVKVVKRNTMKRVSSYRSNKGNNSSSSSSSSSNSNSNGSSSSTASAEESRSTRAT